MCLERADGNDLRCDVQKYGQLSFLVRNGHLVCNTIVKFKSYHIIFYHPS